MGPSGMDGQQKQDRGVPSTGILRQLNSFRGIRDDSSPLKASGENDAWTS